MTTRRDQALTLKLSEAERMALDDEVRRLDVDADELAKQWVVDRLGRLPTVFGQAPWPSDEDLATPSERLRAVYRPGDVWMLIVTESHRDDAPSFYEPGSPFAEATREACVGVYGDLPEGPAFLEWFARQSFWVWRMAPTPRRSRGRPRREEIDAPTLRLARLIRDTDPELLVAVGAGQEAPIRRAAELAAYRMHDIRVLTAPIRQWRSRYVDDLARLLATSFPATGSFPIDSGERFEYDLRPEEAPLHLAMLRVLHVEGRTCSSREIANVIAEHDLYRRKDGRHPSASQVAARARRYPDLFEVSAAGIAAREGE